MRLGDGRRGWLGRFFERAGRMSAIRRALVACLVAVPPGPVLAQSGDDFVPLTDAMLQDPAPADWLMWRRTLDGWGFSPLDQIDRGNVSSLRLVWSRALSSGSQQGTPLVYDGVMYMPNLEDVIQAIDALSGDLIWEHRRQRPDDLTQFVKIGSANRNIAIYDNLIIDTSTDDYIFALDAATGRQVSLTTERTRPIRPPARSSPTARSSRVEGVCQRGARTRASSRRMIHRPAASCGVPA